MKSDSPFPTSLLSGSALALALSLTAISSAAGQVFWTGNGGDNLWTTPENWSAAVASNGTTDLQFGASGRTQLELGQSWHIHTITFNPGAPAYTFGLATNYLALSLQTDTATTPVIRNSSSVTQTITANISFNHLTGRNRYFDSGTGGLVFNGFFTMSSTKMILQGSGNFAFNNAITSTGNSGSLLLDSSFTGAATFAGSNSFAQSIVVRNGTLRVANSNALSGAGSDVELGIHVPAASSGYAPKLIIGGAHTVSRNILLQNAHLGSVTLGGDTAHTSRFTGNVKMGNTAGKTLTVTAAENGTVVFEGNLETSVSGSDNLDALVKSGKGTVVLAGNANSYSGTTEVHEGRLLVNGAYSVAGGEILVVSGAAFGGSGLVNRNVYLGDEATLVAGNGVDTTGPLHLDGDLVLGNDVTIELTLGPGLTQSGLERLGGDWGFNFDQGFLITGNFDWGYYTGVITGLTGDEAGLLSIDQWRILNTGWEESWFVYEEGAVHLHMIPEPSSALLAGGGLLAAVGWGLRRRRQDMGL